MDHGTAAASEKPKQGHSDRKQCNKRKADMIEAGEGCTRDPGGSKIHQVERYRPVGRVVGHPCAAPPRVGLQYGGDR